MISRLLAEFTILELLLNLNTNNEIKKYEPWEPNREKIS